MIDNAGLRKLIKPQAQRVRLQKTGDTNTKKEFPNGYFKLATANNPKIWRQADYKFGLIDDYEAVKTGTKQAGNTRDLIEKRFTAYHTSRKILYCSSPEREQNSNILAAYNLGDKRKFLIPCPCCGVFIELRWEVRTKDGDTAGITWEVDEQGRLLEDSVGYTCQECGGFFDDKNKSELVNKGFWKPTTKPFKPEFTSYHLSSWYSPHGMTDWKGYVYKWLEAHPVNQARDEGMYQSFMNLNAGEPYIEGDVQVMNINLQKNIRNYDIGIIPEELSLRDGNGKIVLLTCACDLNGKLDDARLDYEVLAWSENGSTYSVKHGSIGTFIPNESQKKVKVDREKWTYENNKHENNVWHEFDKILGSVWNTDTGRQMKIFITGIDTGHCELQAFTYIDTCRHYTLGLKGDKESKYVRFGVESPNFTVGKSRGKLYMVKVGQVKDDLQALINLRWTENDATQPSGFMNFPQPSDGLYGYNNYFSHYEAEHRVIDKEGNFIWKKKTATAQNHLYDCRIYNLALREIMLHEIAKEYKFKYFDWAEYVKKVTGQ